MYAHEKNNGQLNWNGMNIFDIWIRDQGLIDIDIPNKKYTRSNKRRNPTLIKLDRILVDTEWNQMFQGISTKAEMAITSYHSPITAELTTNIAPSRIFRFENYWLFMPEFQNLVSQNWSKGTRTLASISIVNLKLRRLRARIRAWHRPKHSLPNLLSNNKCTSEYLDSIEEWRPLTTIEYILRKNICGNIQRIMKLLALKWR